ncbi:hypothetical protein ACSBR2_020716 [Camellia fascicularis]
MTHNPSSFIKFEYDDHTHRFTRYFISFKACIDGFNHCRPLLFLDATFLKGSFKGFLFAATTKDGNQGLFPLAYAVVDSENTLNWFWFLQQLAQVNLKDKLQYSNSMHRAGLVTKLRHCTYAPTVAAFNQKVRFNHVLTKFHEAHVQYLNRISYYTDYIHTRGNRYREMCSNAAESFNSWIRESRNLPITRG